MTDPRVGFYARPIKAGTYPVTYSADGYISQTITVTVSDRQKVIKNMVLVPINPPAVSPVANFTADHTIIDDGESGIVHFTDLSTNCPTSWFWYVEGGTPETSTAQHPIVSYGSKKMNRSHSFDVKLVVTNDFGTDSILKEKYITVISELPLANFVADKTNIDEGDPVQFTDLSVNAIAWEWYFQGGTPEISTEQNPIVLYQNKGVFDVKLTVTNDNADSDMMLKEKYIVVNEVGVHESEGVKINIFPNPVSQETFINVEAEFPMQKIELMNLLGAVVKTIYPQTASSNFLVSGIEKGIYFMRIETQKGVFVTKVSVQ
jgi:PKD repeat protein